MEEQIIICRERPEPLIHQQAKMVSHEQCQDIDQFFNDSAFLSSEIPITLPIAFSNKEKTESGESSQGSSEGSPTDKPLKEKSKNSIFHNFQKHLIAFVKRIGSPTEGLPQDHPERGLALFLWDSFLKSKSHSKKIFHIVFGIPGHSRSQREIQKLARSFEMFREVREQYGLNSIVRAQQLLRDNIVEKMKNCQKQQLQKNTHVQKIDEFYGYMKMFVIQLKQGPVAKRMTKAKKLKVIKELESHLFQ